MSVATPLVAPGGVAIEVRKRPAALALRQLALTLPALAALVLLVAYAGASAGHALPPLAIGGLLGAVALASGAEATAESRRYPDSVLVAASGVTLRFRRFEVAAPWSAWELGPRHRLSGGGSLTCGDSPRRSYPVTAEQLEGVLGRPALPPSTAANPSSPS